MDEDVQKQSHHVKQEVCLTRPAYRDGKKPTAVKVYTVNQESKYLLVQGVPDLGAFRELVKLFEVYGDLEEHRILEKYPTEQFQEVHLIKYKKIQSARFAKKKLDDWSFYGGVLHVCYAPELESIEETREKLQQRRKIIEIKTRQYKNDGSYDLYKTVKQQETIASHSNEVSAEDREVDIAEADGDGSIQFVSEEEDKEFETGNTYDSDLLDNRGGNRPASIRNIEINKRSHSMTSSPNNIQLQSAIQDRLGSMPHLNWQNTSQLSTYSNTLPNIPVHSNHQLKRSVYPVTSQKTLQSLSGQLVIPSDTGQFMNFKRQKVVPSSHVQNVIDQARAVQHYGKQRNAVSDPKKRNVSATVTSDDESVHNSATEPSNDHDNSDQTRHSESSLYSNAVTSIPEHEYITTEQHQSAGNPGKRKLGLVSETQNEVTEEQLILPPPPKQGKTRLKFSKPGAGLSHARVPSAQAEFPAGFDARLNQPPHAELPEIYNVPMNEKSEISDADKSSGSTDCRLKSVAKSIDNTDHGRQCLEVSHLDAKTEHNNAAKDSDKVIKQITYKGQVPKFIPRQAVVRKKAVTAGGQIERGTNVSERANKELRKNAFTLGKTQGPDFVGHVKDNKPDSSEMSVNKTITAIRKRLKEVT